MSRVGEAGLRSEDHKQWADAIMRCQSNAPWECGKVGECLSGGDCFTTDRQGACAAWRMIQNLKTDNAVVQRHLNRAVKFLRYGKADE